MIHVTQQRQLTPWLMNDTLFKFSSMKKEHDESLDILHKFTRSVIAGKQAELKLVLGPIKHLGRD